MGLVSCNSRVQKERLAYTMIGNQGASLLSYVVDAGYRSNRKRTKSQYSIIKNIGANQKPKAESINLKSKRQTL